MANPFFIDPMGGYGPSIVQGIGQAAGGIAEQQQADQLQQAKAAQQAEMQAAFASGDPKQVSSVMIKYPDMREAMTAAVGHLDEASKANMASTIRALLANPDKAEQIISSRVASMRQVYGDDVDLDQTIGGLEEYKQDPEAFMRNVEMLAPAYLSDQEWKAYSERKTPTPPTGTANIKDWNHYQELLKTDPEGAEMFARQVGITETAETALKPTTAMQNYEKWTTMPEGPERKAFGRMIGIDPKEKPEDALKKIESMDKVVREIESSDAVVSMADSLLANQDYIDAITGFRGATPFSVPGTSGFDAMVAFEQMKDNLTLENLNKMSGVLTDKDIQILSSAGAGLKAGMSEDSMRKQLNKIRSVLMAKTERQRGKLEGMGFKPEAETITDKVVNWSDL